MTSAAITVDGAKKRYRIYRRRETTLKSTIIRGRRGVYDEFAALDGVSFEIPHGQAVGIVGRNGAGKSTLLKLLARIIEPDAGSITIDGRVSALLEVGAGFHPEYTAIENIYLSGAIYGISRKELAGRVDEIIAFAELERFADNPVKTYSSGMFARLGFAIAVNVDPDVLLVDEVLAVGDQSFQARCIDRMLEFRNAGKTLVLVTHDLGAVESFCERAIWIDKGLVREDALPHHAIRAYVADVNQQDEAQSRAARERGSEVAPHRPTHESHPVHLTSMSFTSSDGDEREVFHTGEPMRVRISYTAQEAQPDPICEFDIERHDGTLVSSASTRVSGFTLPAIEAGDGWFEWQLDSLTLTPGTYYFTPRILERTGMHAYDEHVHWYRIRVHTGTLRERRGAAILPGVWSASR
ncbi:MAG: lipopolysaccharide transport system ATP-binding protein [Gaiellales bacterium]|nr:lipopolysaccharide transport system ATP-binding protein [Gaiellales bacterium]